MRFRKRRRRKGKGGTPERSRKCPFVYTAFCAEVFDWYQGYWNWLYIMEPRQPGVRHQAMMTRASSPEVEVASGTAELDHVLV